MQVFTLEFLANFPDEQLPRQMVSTALDEYLEKNSIGEIGEREIISSGGFDWHTETIAYRASVMAKRPYRISHWRAGA